VDAGSGRTVRIVLADDRPVVRRGLQQVLGVEPAFTVVTEVGDIKAVENAIREHAADVLLLDLNMPGGSSLDAIPGLRERVPDTDIVVLTMEDDPATIRRARAAGARGYVLKDAAENDLVEAVRRAVAGESYINRRAARILVSERITREGWD
jgi:two-component system, NarL family, response regulator NreC